MHRILQGLALDPQRGEVIGRRHTLRPDCALWPALPQRPGQRSVPVAYCAVGAGEWVQGRALVAEDREPEPVGPRAAEHDGRQPPEDREADQRVLGKQAAAHRRRKKSRNSSWR